MLYRCKYPYIPTAFLLANPHSYLPDTSDGEPSSLRTLTPPEDKPQIVPALPPTQRQTASQNLLQSRNPNIYTLNPKVGSVGVVVAVVIVVVVAAVLVAGGSKLILRACHPGMLLSTLAHQPSSVADSGYIVCHHLAPQ